MAVWSLSLIFKRKTSKFCLGSCWWRRRKMQYLRHRLNSMRSCSMRSAGRWSRRRHNRRHIPRTNSCRCLHPGQNCPSQAHSGNRQPTTPWETPRPVRMWTPEVASSHALSTPSSRISTPRTRRKRPTRRLSPTSRTSLWRKRGKSEIWRICTWGRLGWSQSCRK